MAFRTRGMNQDLSSSIFNPEFSFENINLRLSTNENNTQMSWVNEKGTSPLNVYDEEGQNIYTLHGHPIGTAVIGKYLILFTTIPSGSSIPTGLRKDSIYRLEFSNIYKNKLLCRRLYNGSLGFFTGNPIETLPSYESEAIQKVYWTDGKNSPRVINICQDDDHVSKYTNVSFDFVPILRLNEKVEVQKIIGASGAFASGVIQYAFTYYHQYGQESNIFYTTPLYYISHRDRGAAPDAKVDNAFRITITNPDREFDFLRIYSIQRTSMDAIPLVKRVTDIQLDRTMENGNYPETYSVSYIDRGLTGNSIDPTELLYKGGESIKALTMEQKDSTLFFGNISIDRPQIELFTSEIQEATSITPWSRSFYSEVILEGRSENTNNYGYCNQLTSYKDPERTQSVPCGGFKGGNYYRFGLQFQYKTGKWSSPIWYGKDMQEYYWNEFKESAAHMHAGVIPAPSIDEEAGTGKVVVPTFKGSLTRNVAARLYQQGYRKVRPVVVFPTIQDKLVLCQGVVNPTMYVPATRDEEKGLDAQASWFFRPMKPGAEHEDHYNKNMGTVAPENTGRLPYVSRGNYYDNYYDDPNLHAGNFIVPVDESFNHELIRTVEIQGDFINGMGKSIEELTKYMFHIDRDFLTLNSPDIAFDDNLSVVNYTNTDIEQVGYAGFKCTYSDIEIQTETPPISSVGAGFVHKSFTDDSGPFGIVSGLFYDDYIVQAEEQDKNYVFKKLKPEKSSCLWMVYTWNKSGSLNNDVDRPSNAGTASAKLKKKVISNLRYSNSVFNISHKKLTPSSTPELFSSDENIIIKLGKSIYRGNIDTLLLPRRFDGMHFMYRQSSIEGVSDNPSFTTTGNWWVTFSASSNSTGKGKGLYKRYDNREEYGGEGLEFKDPDTGVIFKPDYVWHCQNSNSELGGFVDLLVKKEGVRMKYKSTPHLVVKLPDGSELTHLDDSWTLPIVEVKRNKPDNIFGGETEDALRENVWVPCGEPVSLPSTGGTGVIDFYCDYGDTYYQRWDCLKTYPYTREDINQVVEIGSFMLESQVNVDGRYDRNRAQISNINMSPINFNLMNKVYSQVDNFFSYKIPPKDTYENIEFTNQLTWTLTKQSGADVDQWTHVSLGSTLELDGDKGRITKLVRFNDQLLAFQEQGFCQVLYNENAQISTTQGTPIEIANSGKVQGKRYFSDSIGCSNKWSVVNTSAGVYFMDNLDKGIYLFNGQLNNLSSSGGFNTWCKKSIKPVETFVNKDSNLKVTTEWDPLNFDNFVGYYDKQNQDILFINDSIALAFSEKLGTFTSFYNYGNAPYFCNFKDIGIWVHRDGTALTKIWKHRGSDSYCNFFGEDFGYGITLIVNAEPQMDKIFTNLEFRSNIDYDIDNSFLPFDSLEVWNEHQHGITSLSSKNGHGRTQHHTSDGDSSLNRKFRIWRCDIPRDNASLRSDLGRNIFRSQIRPNDRMRNNWLYLSLQKTREAGRRAEIHDMIVTYFG